MGDLGEDSAQRKLNLSYPFLLTNKVEKRIASCFLSWFTLGYNRNWANKFFQFCRSCNLKNVKCEWKITDHNLPSFFSYFFHFWAKEKEFAMQLSVNGFLLQAILIDGLGWVVLIEIRLGFQSNFLEPCCFTRLARCSGFIKIAVKTFWMFIKFHFLCV